MGAFEEPPLVQSSSRGESHPPALTEPDVNLSAHPALAGRLGVAARRCQWAKSRGLRCCSSRNRSLAS